MKSKFLQFVHPLAMGVHTQRVSKKNSLMCIITVIFIHCPYCPHIEPIKLNTKKEVGRK